LVFDDSGIFFYLCGFGMLLFGYGGGWIFVVVMVSKWCREAGNDVL
jgi:hypothetical protein